MKSGAYRKATQLKGRKPAAAKRRTAVAPSRPAARRPRAPFPLKPVLETLEPRLLLSADAFPLAPELAYAADAPAPAGAIVAPSETAQATAAALSSSRELVFVDPRVPDSRALLAALLGDGEAGRSFEVIALDATRDGLVQVTAALKSRMQIDAVHFITHGSDGAIQLGGTLLDAQTLAANLDMVGSWASSLKADADLLFYGCDLAATARGRALVDWLAEVTGADVAASTDPTGHASRGGDWDLEYKAGAIETAVAASAAVQTQWTGLLAAPAGGEFRVNTATGGTQNEAAVARDALGNFVVVWTSNGQDGSGNGVYGQRYNAAGVAQGAAFRVNTATADDQQAPAIAMDDAGNFVVVWQSHNQDGGSWGVYAQRYNALGVAQGPEFLVNTVTANDQQAPTVAMNGAGAFVIAWQSNGQDGDNWGIFARRYSAAGAAQDLFEFQVNTSTAKEQENPAIAIDASGNFIVAWQSKDQDGDNYGVYARRYDAAGFPLAGEFRVNTAIAKEQQSPAVAMAPDGRFVVAWQSKDQDGNTWGVYAQRFDAGGAKVGGEFRVNTFTNKEQQSPAVAMAADGRFTIAWQSNDQDGNNDWGIFAQDYSAAGTTIGAEFRVSTTTSNAQQAPAIAMNRAGLGHYVVAWDGDGSGDSTGIYAQRYAALANGTILDLFNAASFSGNDGLQNWENDWQELGETGGSIGPNSGTVRVEGGSLRIGGDGVSIAGRGASRTADLSGATTATLTFSYRRQDIDGGGGNYNVEVSPDGSTWIMLANYSVSGMPSTYTTASFDISAAISANTLVRFVGSGSTSSYFRVDYVQIEHNGTAVNQAPVLDAGKTPVLAPVNEDAGAPVGAVGTLVSQLVDLAVPAGQLDNVADPDAGGVLGIAVTGTNAANGTWWYSLDDGASWNLVGAVSDSSALLLAANGSSRLYFEPNPNFYGTVPNAITFRAWDQTTGTNGNVADTTLNGGTTAFSVATDTASITVNGVADDTLIVDTVDDVVDGNVSSLDALLMDKGADGFVSLREAILAANASPNGSGPDRILFDIAGPGVHTINLLSALPTITDAVIIDGASEPDFAGTPVIELNGFGAGPAADGFNIASGGSTIRGFIINRFGGDGIDLSGGGGNTIVGNWIGTDAAGTGASFNTGVGIRIASGNNLVGGTTSADRNVISGNNQDGVYITAASGNVVRGNTIGLEAAGDLAVGNLGAGVWIHDATGPNTIGGTGPNEGNVISGNGVGGGWQGVLVQNSDGNLIQGNIVGLNAAGTAARPNGGAGIELNSGSDANLVSNNVVSGNTTDGIVLWNATGNTVRSNLIGTDATGTVTIGNGDYGVWITSAANNTIGGTGAADGNVIAGNGLGGVDVEGNTSTGNAILGNRIYANAGLRIDLAGDGVTPNDAGDADGGPNLRQNHPTFSRVTTYGAQIEVVGTLNSTASSTFRIEVFSANAFLGAFNVTTDVSGNATFNQTLLVTVAVGEPVSATATNTATNDTSEFGPSFAAAANVAPVASNVVANGTEDDASIAVTLAGSDTEGPVASFRLAALPANGTLYVDAGLATPAATGVDYAATLDALTLYFVPAADWNGTTAFQFTATDGAGLADATPATATINVAAVNDAPVLSALGAAVAYTENAPATPVDPAVTVSDVDNATLASATVRITAGYANGEDVLGFTPAGGITGLWDAPSGTLTLTGPATLADWQSVLQSVAYQNTSDNPTAGARTIELVVNDGAASSAPVTRSVNVTPVNDAPVAGNDGGYAVNEDAALSVAAAAGVLANDTDVDSAPLTAVLVAGPANAAAFALNADGSFNYTPRADFFGTDTFTYQAFDGTASSNVATVTITVNGVADDTLIVDTVDDVVDGNVTSLDALLANKGADGFVSLREAILAANASPNGSGPDRILFDIAGPGVHTINLLSVLPTITDAVIIDGASEPDFAGTPVIELNGALAGAGVHGLTITAGGSTVRGLVINQFSQRGISLSGGGGNTIVGNYLGTDATGSLDRGNGWSGIALDNSANNVIGGTTAPDRNVISGNGVDGVQLNGSGSTGNLIQGNYIGVNAAGTAALGNTEAGVDIDTGAHDNTVAGNVISGNVQSGIELADAGTTGNVVRGNLIGTNAAGTAAIGNGQYGIWLAANDNLIGGTTVADRNVVSGNAIDGIFVDGASGNVIQGNYIGTNTAGTAAIANAEDGIWLHNASNTLIGGPGAGNLISGNSWSGIALTGGGTDNRIQGNAIGVDATGSGALANLRHGVQLLGSSGTMVGGTAAGTGNVIANNGLDGVSIESGTGHSVLGNTMRANGGLGIDLANDGVTANDLGDADGGPNQRLNMPVIYSVLYSAGSVTITGEARPGATVQFFKAAADPSGYGEGETFVGSGTASGILPGTVDITAVRFSFTFAAGPLAIGDAVTATATNSSGSTSEFSANAFVSGSPPGITVTPVSGLVTTEDGGTATFTVVLDSKPGANVTIALSSTNTGEGTVSPATLVFTSANWNVAQTVTVTGVGDFVTDGSVAYSIVLDPAVSADAGYNGIDPADVSVTNLDGTNDAPVVNVPGAQIGAEDVPFVFSTGTGNAIWISDSDAGPNPVEVTLTATQGTITLAGTTGLTFSVGTGTGEATMTFTGTLVDVNAALDGLTFATPVDFIGTANLAIATNDLGGSGAGGPQGGGASVDIDFVAVNDAPTIDLDADDSSGAGGSGFQRTYTEQSGPRLIVDAADAVLADVDSANLASITVRITNADFDGAVEFLSADTSATPLITANYNAGTGVLTLNGAAPIADYEQVLRTVRYENTSDAPSANPRLIAFVASDGGSASAAATATVTISPVNDGPFADIAPASYSATEGTPLVLHGTGLSVGDIDAGPTAVVTAGFWVTSGLVTAAAGSTGVGVSGSGTPSLTLTGTIAQINDLLAGNGGATLYYIVGSDSPPATDDLTLWINDGGATGSGGARWASDWATIDVTAVNDAPIITLPGTASTAEDTALVFSAAGANPVSITDVDAAGAPVLVTLSVTNGVLSLNPAGLGALAFSSGDGTADASMTFTGTVAAINAALDGLVFQPDPDYNGQAFMMLSVDDQGASGTGGALGDADSMTITVTPANDPPAGADNTVSTPQDTAYTFVATDFGFTDGDAGDSMSGVRVDALTLPPGATLRLAGVDVVASDFIATADITAGNLVFTPAAGAGGVGYASFTFSVRDAGGAFDPSPNTMTIDVSNAPVNTIPGPQTVDVDTDLAIGGLSVADPDFDLDTVALAVGNGTLTVTLSGGASITAGANGSAGLTLSGTEADINATLATLVYRGAPAYAGPDTLTVTSTDLVAQQDVDSVAITVSPVNAAPSATIASASYAATEQVPLVLTGELWVDDADAGASIVTARISAASGNLLVSAGGTGAAVAGSGSPVVTLTGTVLQIQNLLSGGSGASVRYLMSSDSPPASDTLTLWITDNHPTDPRTASASAAITIGAVNDAPVNTLPGAPVTAEDTPLVFNAAGGNQIYITDVDAGGAPLLVTLSASNGVISLSGTTGLAFSVGDGTADATMTFTGTLAAINSALDNLVFAPNLNYNGLAFITMNTDDQGATGAGGAQTDLDLATITVTPVNDAPSGTDTTVIATEDTPYTFTLSRFGFTDVDSGDAMTDVRIDTLSLPAGATLRLSGVDVVAGQIITVADINAGNLVFTPVADANGANYASFTFSVRDTGVPPGPLFAPTPNTMTIDVAPVNDLPVITSNGGMATAAISIAENSTAATTVTATDVDLQPLTFSIAGGVDAALFTINATSGVLLFVAPPNFEAPADTGADNVYDVTVRVSDGAGGSDTQALAITVTNVDDAPFALADAYATNEDSALTVTAAAGLLANDYDEDGSPVTAALVSGPAYGTLALNADGSFVYTPNANFFGTDSFVYRVSDGSLQSGDATVTISVNGVQDAPTAADGNVTTMAATDYTFAIADFGYNDVDGDPLAQIQITALPASGTLRLAGVPVTLNQVVLAADIAAGQLTYSPPASASTATAGQFGFRVHDGFQYEAGTHTMTIGVTIVVAPPPPPPPPTGGGTPPPPPSGGSGGSGSSSEPGSGGAGGGGEEAAVSGGGRAGSGGGESAQAPQAEVAAPDKVEAPAPAADSGAGVVAPTAASAFTSTANAALAAPGTREGAEAADPRMIQPEVVPMTVEQQAIQAISEPAFREELDKLRRHQEQESIVETRVAGSVFAVSTSLSVGYVLWLLRGGVLLTSLLSSLPAWRVIDPLPVLSRMGGADEDEDDDSLEELVSRDDEGPEAGPDADDVAEAPDVGRRAATHAA